MEDRRTFLKTAAMAAWIAGSSATARARTTSSHGLHCVVIDDRHAESVAFAQESHRLGTGGRLTHGDVTRLWYEELHAQWRRQPVAIAGLTAHGPLFCLERWAWEHGMRVVLRIDHHRSVQGVTRHLVAADGAPTLLQRRLDAAGTEYPVAAARAAHRCVQGRYQVSSPPGVLCAADDPEPLISWVIAPLQRA